MIDEKKFSIVGLRHAILVCSSIGTLLVYLPCLTFTDQLRPLIITRSQLY